MRDVGSRIKQLRKQRGLSQQQLADQAGVHLMTISDIETGRTQKPDLETLEKIADVLGVALGTLIAPPKR